MDENADGKIQAENSLRLAKRLAPDKTIPKHIFNDGHEIHEIYAGLEYIELDSDIPTSARGVYIFNGQTINRPANTKTIVQIKEGNTILLSAVTKAGDPLPGDCSRIDSRSACCYHQHSNQVCKSGRHHRNDF